MSAEAGTSAHSVKKRLHSSGAGEVHMSFDPPYSALFELVLSHLADPAFADDLSSAREEYFRHTGEVSEEHHSYDIRLQAFLDWYSFDRILPHEATTPVLAAAADPRFSQEERDGLIELADSIHSIFELRKQKEQELVVRNVITRLEHKVAIFHAIPGLEKGDLFEARLVPSNGALHLSPAFLLHPRSVRRQLLRGIKRHLKQGVGTTELVWLLSRMAARGEHYKNLSAAEVYDFDNPPPVSNESRIRFDPASVALRRSRTVVPLPIPEWSPESFHDEGESGVGETQEGQSETLPEPRISDPEQKPEAGTNSAEGSAEGAVPSSGSPEQALELSLGSEDVSAASAAENELLADGKELRRP